MIRSYLAALAGLSILGFFAAAAIVGAIVG